MNGKGTGTGIEFQARVLAWVYVHILAGHHLSWTRPRSAAIPHAVQTETGTAGDDVVVELAGTKVWFDAQAKKGFSRGADFEAVIKGYLTLLLDDPSPHCFLIVDRTSSRPITDDLPEDLSRLAAGRSDGLHPIGEHVRSIAESLSGTHVLGRLHVVTMDLLLEGSAHQDAALQKLREVLEKPSLASQVWEILIADAVRLIREAGRRDRDRLVGLLEGLGFACVAQGSHAQLTAMGSTNLDLATTTPPLHSDSGPASDAAEHDSWARGLDYARQLIDRGRADSAAPLLEDLRHEASTASKRTGAELGKLHNLIGIVKLRRGDTTAALEDFERAIAFDPSSFAPYLNAATVLLGEGKADEAYDLSSTAVELMPSSEGCWAMLSQAAIQSNRTVEVPTAFADAPEVLAARGRAAFAAEQWDEGIALLRRANDGATHPDPQHLVTLASGLLNKTAETTDAADQELEEAAGAAQRALILLANSPNSALEAEALLLRGLSLQRLGRSAVAEEAFAQAASVPSHNNWRPTYLLALNRLNEGDHAEALRLVDAFPNATAAGPLRALRGRALSSAGRDGEARTEIEAAVSSTAHLIDGPTVFAMAVETAILAEYSDLAARLLDHPPDSLEGSDLALLRARSAEQTEGWETAEQHYEEAIASARNVDQIRAEFAMRLLRNDKPDSAVVQIEQIPQANRTGAVQKCYARALTEIGAWSKASAVADEVRRHHPNERWATELAAEIARRRGDLTRQESLLRELHASHPGEVRYLLQLIQVLIAQNDHEDAQLLLAEARGAPELTAYDRLTLASLHIAAGQPGGALPLAFAALRADPDNERVQVAYINIFLQRPSDAEDLNPSEVAVGTHVIVEDRDGQRTGYTILPDPPVSPGRNEYLGTDPVVQPLLGLRVGGSIVRRKGAPTEMEYTVVEIKAAYVSAFQHVLKTFHERHPENTTIQSFRVGQPPTIEDLAPVVGTIEAHKRAATDLLDSYRKHGLPLGSIATTLGKPIPAVYAAIAGARDQLLYVEYSTQDAMEGAIAAAQAADRVVVTRSALVTLQELDLLDWAAALPVTYVAGQSLVDEVQREIEELELMPGRAGTLSSVGGQLVVHEDRKEDLSRYRLERRRVAEWIDTHVTIDPLPLGVLDVDSSQWPTVLGKSSLDAYALAGMTEALLYCDDLGLRRLAIKELGNPRGFSTVALLIGANWLEKLSAESLDEMLGKLIALNHFFVPVRASVLEASLRQAGYQIDGRVIRVFDRLRGQYCATPQAVDVSVSLIRSVALSTGAAYLKMLVSLILECLSDGHPAQTSITAFRQLANRRLELLPLARDRVEEAIRDFLAARAFRHSSPF